MADQFLNIAARLPSEQPRGAAPYMNVDTPPGAFGAIGAQQLQQAGARLEQASDSAHKLFQAEAADANDAHADSLLNGFVDGKQKILFTNPDAFYRQKGEAAIHAAEPTTKALTDLKEQTLEQAGNDAQRRILRTRLDAHFRDATDGIGRHVDVEAASAAKTTRDSTLNLAAKDAALDPENDQNLKKNLVIAEDVALASAKAAGFEPDSPVAKDLIGNARSKVFTSSLQSLLDGGKNRSALSLYERIKDDVAIKGNTALHTTMKGIRAQVDGEDLAARTLRANGLPGIQSDDSSSTRENNIGNLRPPGASQGFQTFKTFDEGVAGAVKNLQAYPKAFNDGKPMTLQQIGAKWAPKGDGANDPNQWAKNVGAAAGLDPTKPVDLSSPEIAAKVARGIHQAEWGRARPEGDYLPGAQAAFGTPGVPVFKGDLKAGYEKAAFDISNSNASREDKQAALAIINKQSTQVTSYQTAAVKSLKDEADSYRLSGYLEPAKLDPGKLLSFAERAQALGEQSLAGTYRVLAALAPTVKNDLQSMPADQLKLLKSMEEGPAKKLIEGIESGNADTLTRANDLHDKLKKAQADGLDPAGLKDMATKTAQLYVDGGKSEKAQEVAQTYRTMLAASETLKANPVAQKQALAEIEGIAGAGQVNEQQAELHRLLSDGIKAQAAAFDKDAYAAGQKLYGLPQRPLTDGAGRMQDASQIASARGLTPGSVPPMSQEEFNALRSQADANPQQAQKTFRQIAANYPAEAIPLIGAGLAGKPDTSDPVSRGYAAALNFYAEGQKDPSQTLIGDEILDGVAKRKEMGDALRNMPKSDAFHEAVQTKLGNAFMNLSGKVPAIIVNAAEAIYTSRMIKAGRQGEKALDDTILNSALDAVVGKTVVRNGQSLLPPKGVDGYQLDAAVRSLSDGDVDGFHTQNGSPVTAEKIARYGILSNAGKDGTYFVQMPDPAQGGKPAYVQRPDGRPYVLDIAPLLERAQRFPGYAMETPNSAAAARRRAPASPTEGVQP